MDLPPVIDQCVFQDHAVGQKEREPRPFFHHFKQAQLFSKFAVIPFFGLFQPGEVFFKFGVFGERDTVNAHQHLIFFIAAPVCTCDGGQFKRLDRAGGHQVWAGTQVVKLGLFIKTDRLAFSGMFPDQFFFIDFAVGADFFKSLFRRQLKALQRNILFDDFFHFGFDLDQIFWCKRVCAVKIIIKAVVDRRPNGQFDVWIQPLDRLCHHMSGCMPKGFFAAFVVKCQDI